MIKSLNNSSCFKIILKDYTISITIIVPTRTTSVVYVL